MGRPQDPVPAGRWYVLVEASRGNTPFAIVVIRAFATHEEAVADAVQLTLTYKKPAVVREKGRWIFRTGPDSWTVLVERATYRPHFRIWVAYLEYWVSER